jgi:S-adenosylmethionine hydrolase
MLIDTGKYKFIGPNNGIFHHILKDKSLNSKIYTIKNDFKTVESNTFHGRDIMTPIAIELALGNNDILAPLDEKDVVLISSLEKNSFIVTYIDGFGNVKTNFPISNKMKAGNLIKVRLGKDVHKIRFVRTFCDVKCGELLCYNGSNNTMEIAANLSSARNVLGIKVGDTILFEA